jgi:PAS domain S-box-containing protein
VIIINANSTIQMTNQAAMEMFGYARTEMRGKQVTMLLPQPVALSHHSFVRSCVTTGR